MEKTQRTVAGLTKEGVFFGLKSFFFYSHIKKKKKKKNTNS